MKTIKILKKHLIPTPKYKMSNGELTFYGSEAIESYRRLPSSILTEHIKSGEIELLDFDKPNSGYYEEVTITSPTRISYESLVFERDKKECKSIVDLYDKISRKFGYNYDDMYFHKSNGNSIFRNGDRLDKLYKYHKERVSNTPTFSTELCDYLVENDIFKYTKIEKQGSYGELYFLCVKLVKICEEFYGGLNRFQKILDEDEHKFNIDKVIMSFKSTPFSDPMDNKSIDFAYAKMIFDRFDPVNLKPFKKREDLLINIISGKYL